MHKKIIVDLILPNAVYAYPASLDAHLEN